MIIYIKCHCQRTVLGPSLSVAKVGPGRYLTGCLYALPSSSACSLFLTSIYLLHLGIASMHCKLAKNNKLFISKFTILPSGVYQSGDPLSKLAKITLAKVSDRKY